MIEADELRIIAKDAVLSAQDRATLDGAADALEQVQKQLIATQSALLESQRHRIALTELVIKNNKDLVPYKFVPYQVTL